MTTITFSFYAQLSFAASNDTTYGDVQIKDKASRPATYPTRTDTRPKPNPSDNDSNSIGSIITGAVVKGIMYGLYCAYVKPFVEIAAGHEYLTETKQANHVALSLGNAAVIYSGIAAGAQFQFDVYDYYRASDRVGFGFKTGFDPAIMGINKDFQRTVYVNGSAIGVQTDESIGYGNIQVPIEGLIQFFPAGRDGSFYMYVGGGVNYVHESLKLFRTSTINASRDSLTIVKNSFMPVVSIGTGRFVEGNSILGNFSFEYSVSINPNAHDISLPSDNTPFSHAISLRWSLVL